MLLIGNSVIAWNVAHDVVQSCCGDDAAVAKMALTRLSMLESAMLGSRLIQMRPDLIVMSMNRLDMTGTSGWDNLRFYDPDVAWRLSTPEDLMAHRNVHLSGVLNHTFLLFRHRRGLLQFYGYSAGLPLGSMLDFKASEMWIGEDFHTTVPPTIETRALRDLARQLRANGIRLLLISAPTHDLVDPPIEGEPISKARKHQPAVDSHLRRLSKEEGFAFAPHTAFKGLKPEMFRDSMHLNAQARARFTGQLSQMMMQTLQASENDWARIMVDQ